MGRTEKCGLSLAEASYKQAVHCDAGYFQAVHALAGLYMRENKPAESASVLLKAQSLMPQDWLARLELGRAHYAMGDYAEAVQDLLIAQSFHPQMPAAFHIQLANAYLKTGSYGRALEQINSYLTLSPNGPYSANARKMADKLKRQGVTATPSAPKP